MRLHLLLVSLCALQLACSSSVESAARSRYNLGVELLADGKLDAAETALLEARSEAGADQLLRYRAAFNLGLVKARRAQELEAQSPEEALSALMAARNWFQDAARVISDDQDALANLQLISRRLQMLADRLNQGTNGLEARLDQAIEAERSLRDRIRGLMETVEAAGAAGEPIAFRDAFEKLATDHRALLADVGTLSDLVADELALLDGKAEPSQEEEVRKAQLTAMEQYVISARQAMDDARRRLHELDSQRSHLRSTAALADLKRAREQLLDPVTVLKAVAQDEIALARYSEARLELGKGTIALEGGKTAAVPPWLEPQHLAEQQADALSRTSEVLARFEAAVAAPPPADPSGADPETTRAIAMAGKAAPHLREAVSQMQKAQDALAIDNLEEAIGRQTDALRALYRAIEFFSDLASLVELTYAEHMSVVSLIDPDAAQAPGEGKPADMTPQKRAETALEATRRDVDRLERMIALIQQEQAAAKEKAAQGQDPADAGGDAAQAAEQIFGAAEQYRAAAAAKLAELAVGLEAIAAGKPAPGKDAGPLVVARGAQKDLEELRRIFFTIVQHLKELHRDQSNTRDATGSAAGVDDTEHAALLPPLADSQSKHAAMAESLASALEAQADAAAAAPDPQAQGQAQKFADAATEVRSALDAMNRSRDVLRTSAENAANMSVDFSEALALQPKALEHIENAIRILEPPQQNQDQQDQEDQQDQQDQEQDQQDQEQQQQEDVSKQDAQRKLQRIRDREAERQREREHRQQAPEVGVDKDW